MKRHPDLLQLSREHHGALRLALHYRHAAGSSNPDDIGEMARRVASFFNGELDRHFHIEEQGILAFLKQIGEHDMARRTLAEHEELRKLIGALSRSDAATLLSFADLLAVHVRFEERDLIPLAEAMLRTANPCPSVPPGEMN